MVNENNGWPAPDLPLGGDRSAASSCPKRSPIYTFFFHNIFEFVPVFVAVDSNKGKRLILHSLHERPLVMEHGPAGRSPIPPEIQHDDFAAIVTELE